jgi:hypothetical protein
VQRADEPKGFGDGGVPGRTERRTGDDNLLALIYEQRRRLRQAAIGYLILVAAVAIALFLLEQRADKRIEVAQRGACERLQLVRDRVNAIERVGREGYLSGAHRERLLARMGRDERLHRESARALQRVADSFMFTAPTDCDAAVDDPAHYQPPRPVPLR